MDPTRDNPIIRFATFWWALGTFMVFALLLTVIWMFNRKAPESLEDVVAKVRYENKAKIAQAQAASLPQDAIDAAIPAVAGKLLEAKPVAVENPAQVVPGTPTAAKLAPPAPAPPTPGAAPAPTPASGTAPATPPAPGAAPAPVTPPAPAPAPASNVAPAPAPGAAPAQPVAPPDSGVKDAAKPASPEKELPKP